jgi:hypothetical protein
MAIRFDAGRLGKIERTPQGGARIPAALTRTGVLNYLNADGSTRRELRPPEEVFRQDSLATLRSATVTEGHAAWITPENYQTHTRGHVAENVREDGSLVAAELIVQSSDSLKRIDTRELTELSAGYTCDFDPTPGEWQGQRYDGVQRNIKYNHVALLAPGAGRAGRECGLRLDSAAAICVDEFPAPAGQQSPGVREGITTMKIRFDGKEYDLASTTDLAALQGVLDKSRTDAAAAIDALKEANTKAEKATARADGLDVELKKEREEFPKRLDSAVAARVNARDHRVCPAWATRSMVVARTRPVPRSASPTARSWSRSCALTPRSSATQASLTST